MSYSQVPETTGLSFHIKEDVSTCANTTNMTWSGDLSVINSSAICLLSTHRYSLYSAASHIGMLLHDELFTGSGDHRTEFPYQRGCFYLCYTTNMTWSGDLSVINLSVQPVQCSLTHRNAATR
ncbi:hypothetical protein J6590_091930 [Homalodisca vitripennis]|nr:hypothetical protein J6590_091930 [Homalodisca vitripennis]